MVAESAEAVTSGLCLEFVQETGVGYRPFIDPKRIKLNDRKKANPKSQRARVKGVPDKHVGVIEFEQEESQPSTSVNTQCPVAVAMDIAISERPAEPCSLTPTTPLTEFHVSAQGLTDSSGGSFEFTGLVNIQESGFVVNANAPLRYGPALGTGSLEDQRYLSGHAPLLLQIGDHGEITSGETFASGNDYDFDFNNLFPMDSPLSPSSASTDSFTSLEAETPISPMQLDYGSSLPDCILSDEEVRNINNAGPIVLPGAVDGDECPLFNGCVRTDADQVFWNAPIVEI